MYCTQNWTDSKASSYLCHPQNQHQTYGFYDQTGIVICIWSFLKAEKLKQRSVNDRAGKNSFTVDEAGGTEDFCIKKGGEAGTVGTYGENFVVWRNQ